MSARFWVVSEKHGLAGTAETQGLADTLALVVAVHTARTVYVHDRHTESIDRRAMA